MFEWYLFVDKDHVEQSYFEKVWADKQDKLGSKNHISYDIHRCDQKVYCAEINAERCDYNRGYESSYRSYNLKNGLRFKLLEMFTSEGKDRFTEKLKYKKKKRIDQGYLKADSLYKADPSKENRGKYYELKEFYHECYDDGVQFGYLEFIPLEGELIVLLNRCYPWIDIEFEEVGFYEIHFTYDEIRNDLNDFGKAILSE